MQRQRMTPGLTTAMCLALVIDVSAQSAAPPRHDRSRLAEFAAAVEKVTHDVSSSIVQVLVDGYGPRQDKSLADDGLVVGPQQRIGSGVILDGDGYIVTNAHVVAGARRIQVIVPRSSADDAELRNLVPEVGQTVEAEVVGTAPEIDVALLKIAATGLQALRVGDDKRVRQGELVFAFGSPGGLFNSVTMGVVSAVARQPDPDSPLIFIQTDAPISPGSSGGPLVNVDGELVGLSTFILSDSGSNEGLGFAIPATIVSAGYQQLRKHGQFRRGVVGIRLQAITSTLAAGLGLSRAEGVLVSDVIPGSPAEQAGVQVQDIVKAVDGVAMRSVPMFALALCARAPGETVTMDILRGTRSLVLPVAIAAAQYGTDVLETVIANPEAHSIAKLGILGTDAAAIAAAGPALRMESGVFVAARDEGSLKREIPLKTGDVIHAVDGVSVTTVGALRQLLEGVRRDSPIVLQVERDRRLRFVTLQVF